MSIFFLTSQKGENTNKKAFSLAQGVPKNNTRV